MNLQTTAFKYVAMGRGGNSTTLLLGGVCRALAVYEDCGERVCFLWPVASSFV